MLKKSVQKQLKSMLGISLIIKYARENLEDGDSITDEVLIAYAAKEFKYELSGYDINSLYDLNGHIIGEGQKNGTIIVEGMVKPIYEFAGMGIISIKKMWNRLHFEGVYVNASSSTIISINGNEFDSGYRTKKQLETLKEELSILFDTEASTTACYHDKVHALYDVFVSYKMQNPNTGIAELVTTANYITDYTVIPDEQRYDKLNKTCHEIIDKYLKYLWDKYESDTDPRFILGFESYMSRNKEAWKEGFNEAVERLDMLLPEHKRVLRIFDESRNVEEPTNKYLCRERKRIYRSVYPSETTRSGLGGT
jgi:hypothetical protein